MNTPSQMQMQFPLSPKKFIKKMMNSLIGGFIFALVVGFIIGLIVSGTVPVYADTSRGITAGIGAFVVIYLLRVGIAAWYWKAYIRTYYYDASDAFVTIKKGVFMPTEIHVQYQKIQDVYVDQDLWDRILGIYDVHIASATVSSGIEAHIDGVDFPTAEGLKNILLHSIKHGSMQQSASQVPSAVSSVAAFQSDQEISQQTYPIHPAWIIQKVFTTGAASMVLFFVLISIFTSNGLETSINSSYGTALIIFIAIAVVQIVGSIWWRSTFQFKFMADYLFMREGVITIQEKHVPYNTVQDVIVSQGLIERFFGLATVTIQNASAPQMVGRRMVTGGGIGIPGQPLDKANELSHILRGIVSKRDGTPTGL